MLTIKQFFLVSLVSIRFGSVFAEIDIYVDIFAITKNSSAPLEVLLIKETKKRWYGSYEQYSNPRSQFKINLEADSPASQEEIRKNALNFFNAFLKENHLSVANIDLKEIISGKFFGPFSEFGKRKNHYVYLVETEKHTLDPLSTLKWVDLKKLVYEQLRVHIDPTLKHIVGSKEFQTALQDLSLLPKSELREIQKTLDSLEKKLLNLKDEIELKL